MQRPTLAQQQLTELESSSSYTLSRSNDAGKKSFPTTNPNEMCLTEEGIQLEVESASAMS
jgi:hypothetical protein